LNDQYLASTARPVQSYGLPYFWGVAGLEVQEAGLSNKQFEILNGSFVFPDGTYVAYPGNTALKPRSFEEDWVEGDKPFTVYLGLRKPDPSGQNVTVVGSADGMAMANTRFATTADPEEVVDLHGSGPPAQVKRLSYVLRLFWETEKDQLDNYDLIPVAQLERYGDDIKISGHFLPPCLIMDASDWLIRTIKDIRDQVASRCRQLEEYKSPRELQTMEFDIGYLVFLLALRSLNRYVPLLFHLTETKNLHPWTVYGTLRQLVGELSTFSEELSATGEREDGSTALPPYDHLNLWTCFSTVHKLVGQLLDGITIGPEHLVRLDYDGRYYSGVMPGKVFDRRNRYWLVLKTEAEPEVVVDAASRLLKLSAARNLTTLIARAVPGVPLEYFPSPPPGLPRRANAKYFQIDYTSPLWADVQNAESVSLYWDGAPEDLTAEIIILRS